MTAAHAIVHNKRKVSTALYMMGKSYFSYRLVSAYLFIALLLAGCGGVGGDPGTSKHGEKEALVSAPVRQESAITFSLTGGQSASYILHAASPISKLRHGHREFTIDIEDAQRSIFIVFYGYTGPGSYTLTKKTNGGDVHISLGNAAPAWDLSLQPEASCMMTIHSDTPTALAGLDRMQGTLACPHLFSSNPQVPKPSVTLHDGSFDIGILVES